MRRGRGRGGALPRAPVLWTLALGAGLAACGHLVGAGHVAPSGLPDWDHRLRRHLAEGAADRALELVAPERARAGDELLRLQHEGLVAHYAGEWERSSEAFERAFRLTEDRYTKSVSRAVLSMLASDRVLEYYPPSPERLLLHYYAALNYLRRGEPDEAAVEARRLGRLLEDGLSEGDPAVPADLGAALSHFAGAVFEAAGQDNDAAVAYRRAAAFRPDGDTEEGRRADLGGDPAPARPGGNAGTSDGPDPEPAGRGGADGPGGRRAGAAAGELLVVVERGFVAHKVEEAVTLFLPPGDVETLREVGEDVSSGDRDDAAEALEIAERAIEGRSAGPEGGRPASAGGPGTGPGGSGAARGGRPPSTRSADEGNRGPVLLRIAWPVYRETSRVRGASAVVVGGDSLTTRPVAAIDLSAAVKDAYADRRVLDVAKTLVRAAAKTAVAEGIEDAVSEEDETLGEVAGWTARIAGALLERADTRCWHLLPARIELHRVRLPPGTHRVETVLPGGSAGSLGPGTVEVRPGRTGVVSVRAWD